MTTILTSEQRKQLHATVQAARIAAEVAAYDALHALAVADTHRPSFLNDKQNRLRLALRAKARQLGDDISAGADLMLLTRDVAYEQWHRLLFARFLECNGLLMHPDFSGTSLSLQDCDELARDLGEADGWSLAARFAAQILPGVFRLDDPAFQVAFSTEHRVRLEQLLMSIPNDVFVAEDALGWVYQFWQTAEKKRVNDAGNKIGGADLSPVTQLFTENYMVRFLLENSLGAWWAARHPDSPLVAGWEYLRRLEDGTPAAGTFPEWPERVAEVTVMDPCCGSGHFLVAMFGMLWRMRAEEEGLTDGEAQDAVLRDNLFGLELDPRCTQIATFNVALEAWKQGGYRQIPVPQIACSGVPVRQSREEWLDGVPEHLHQAMGRLHTQFRNADTLGSLIDPRPAEGSDEELFAADMSLHIRWADLQPHLATKFMQESASGAVLGHAVEDVVQAARLLAASYTLVATNPPWLGSGRWSEAISAHMSQHHPDSAGDLAIAFLDRFDASACTVACVLPQSLTSQAGMRAFRVRLLEECRMRVIARLGDGAFGGIKGQVVQPVLLVTTSNSAKLTTLDVLHFKTMEDKSRALQIESLSSLLVSEVLGKRGSRIVFAGGVAALTLGEIADFSMGVQTGDNERFTRKFWEVAPEYSLGGWENYLRSPEATGELTGRSTLIKWDAGRGKFMDFLVDRLGVRGVRSWLRGEKFWGRRGVLISRVGANPVTRYEGEIYSDNAVCFVPKDPMHLGALWALASEAGLSERIDEIDSGPSVTGGTIAAIRIERDSWAESLNSSQSLTSIAQLPCTSSTQWLFKGDIATSTQPLQVAMARLLGYRWPDQKPDDLDHFADADGIVTLPDLGEGDAATRLRELLATAYGDRWSGALEHTLVTDAGGKTGRLEDWLRDSFFAHHCKVFDNRPFLWHVWDGHKDGFSAILHYHRLDRRTLEKLTYTTLGTWVQRQKQQVEGDIVGAEARLVAAEQLQRQLELIIEGEEPYDAYVRWKPMHEQPLGWEPDLDDGVRLNIRPFMTASVLRVNLSTKIKWTKDKGKNPDGTERHNDLHPTLAERRAARAQYEAAGVEDNEAPHLLQGEL